MYKQCNIHFAATAFMIHVYGIRHVLVFDIDTTMTRVALWLHFFF